MTAMPGSIHGANSTDARLARVGSRDLRRARIDGIEGVPIPGPTRLLCCEAGDSAAEPRRRHHRRWWRSSPFWRCCSRPLCPSLSPWRKRRRRRRACRAGSPCISAMPMPPRARRPARMTRHRRSCRSARSVSGCSSPARRSRRAPSRSRRQAMPPASASPARHPKLLRALTEPSPRPAPRPRSSEPRLPAAPVRIAPLATPFPRLRASGAPCSRTPRSMVQAISLRPRALRTRALRIPGLPRS